MKIKTPFLLAALTTSVLAGQTQAQIAGALRAGDDLGGLNLTSYTNAWQATVAGFEFDSAFNSGADAFNIFKRGTSQSVPFAIGDDSISIFPGDTAGIVNENDVDPFFGISDTVNADTTTTSGEVMATWVFDISSATSDVDVKVDLAAMGDFEAADSFVFSIGLDGGGLTQVASLIANEDIDLEYALLAAQPAPATVLNDPLELDGTTLNNVFTTFSFGTVAGSASAASLTLQLVATSDGGNEGVAFRNIIIDEAGGNDPADLDGDGDVDDADFGIAFAAFTGPNNGPSTNPAADLDGDGDVDDADFGIAFAAFTGPGGAAVPEPTSLALLGLGGLLIARRRRG